MSVLSNRETEVLLRLSCYRYLTQSHLEGFVLDGTALKPRSKQVVMQRTLERLRMRDLVAATPRLVGGPGGGSARVGYFLTDAGQRLVGSISPGTPSRRSAARGTFLMAHSLTTAEVALAFLRSADSHRGHELIGWECDWQIDLRLGPSPVIPDARLVYATAVAELDAFIEVDLGTEGSRFFGRKISRYLDLYRSGSWRAHLPAWPLVLTITPSDRRATALRRCTESLLTSLSDAEPLARATEFGFSSLGELRGSNGPLGKIWQVAGRSERQSLLADAQTSGSDGS